MLSQLKNRDKEHEKHPHEWRLAEKPSRKYGSSSSSDITAPSSSIFKDVAIPYSMKKGCSAPPTIQAYPTPGHMAALLLLIECFEKLRHDIEQSTVLREKCPDDVDVWQFYARIAIKRFRIWITKIESIVRHSAVFNRYGTGSHLHGAFTPNYAPPLDVLLIWFCYLQNSSAYERLLASNDLRLLAQISFPWHILPMIINQQTLEYTFNDAAERLWKTFIEIPSRLEDCVDIDLDRKDLAFTSSDDDLLDIVVQEAETFEQIHRYHWLRSPAASGTLQRALKRYVDATVLELANLGQTQQILVSHENDPRRIADLKFDLGQRLVLQAHKGYHNAWKTFSQVYNLAEEDRPPPPVYRRSLTRSLNSLEDICLTSQAKVSLEDCFCWICERVKDEISQPASSPNFTALVPVKSPDTTDEKMSISDSSSSSDEAPDLSLSRKQIKQIKCEITLYRHTEMKRERLALQDH